MQSSARQTRAVMGGNGVKDHSKCQLQLQLQGENHSGRRMVLGATVTLVLHASWRLSEPRKRGKEARFELRAFHDTCFRSYTNRRFKTRHSCIERLTGLRPELAGAPRSFCGLPTWRRASLRHGPLRKSLLPRGLRDRQFLNGEKRGREDIVAAMDTRAQGKLW